MSKKKLSALNQAYLDAVGVEGALEDLTHETFGIAAHLDSLGESAGDACTFATDLHEIVSALASMSKLMCRLIASVDEQVSA